MCDRCLSALDSELGNSEQILTVRNLGASTVCVESSRFGFSSWISPTGRDTSGKNFEPEPERQYRE